MSLCVIVRSSLIHDYFDVQNIANILGDFKEDGGYDDTSDTVCYSLEDDRKAMHSNVAIVKEHVPGQPITVQYPAPFRHFAAVQSGKKNNMTQFIMSLFCHRHVHRKGSRVS